VNGQWIFNVDKPTVAWVDSVEYELQVRAVDNAINSDNSSFVGNADISPALKAFTYETSLPTATITSAAQDGKYSGMLIASGTFIDNIMPPGGGNFTPPAAVNLYIYDQAARRYWNGAAWDDPDDPPDYAPAALFRDSWTLSGMPPQFQTSDSDVKKYTLWSQAVNMAGNTQTAFSTTAFSSMTVTFDHPPP
jgi:hypothetical protein